MTKRTDPHRPGAIIPAEYDYVFSYHLSTSQDGVPIPSFMINCELDFIRAQVAGGIAPDVKHEHRADGRCCVVGLRQAGVKFAETGSAGQCSVCGSAHIYGDVWVHRPTGEHIFVGHICADKYELLVDRSAWELERDRRKAAAAVECEKKRKQEAFEGFCAQNPGLTEAFALKDQHPILADLYSKLRRWESISDKQVGLALKIADEIRNPKPKAIEDEPMKAEIQEGRQQVEGTIISIKKHEGAFGSCLKMTVKVVVPGKGYWLAWGTMPSSLWGEGEKGSLVRFMAILEAGKEPHFALFSRPTKAKVLPAA